MQFDYVWLRKACELEASDCPPCAYSLFVDPEEYERVLLPTVVDDVKFPPPACQHELGWRQLVHIVEYGVGIILSQTSQISSVELSAAQCVKWTTRQILQAHRYLPAIFHLPADSRHIHSSPSLTGWLEVRCVCRVIPELHAFLLHKPCWKAPAIARLPTQFMFISGVGWVFPVERTTCPGDNPGCYVLGLIRVSQSLLHDAIKGVARLQDRQWSVCRPVTSVRLLRRATVPRFPARTGPTCLQLTWPAALSLL